MAVNAAAALGVRRRGGRRHRGRGGRGSRASLSPRCGCRSSGGIRQRSCSTIPPTPTQLRLRAAINTLVDLPGEATYCCSRIDSQVAMPRPEHQAIAIYGTNELESQLIAVGTNLYGIEQSVDPIGARITLRRRRRTRQRQSGCRARGGRCPLDIRLTHQSSRHRARPQQEKRPTPRPPADPACADRIDDRSEDQQPDRHRSPEGHEPQDQSLNTLVIVQPAL